MMQSLDEKFGEQTDSIWIKEIEMKEKIHTGARLLFGTAFIIFGLNGFLQFMQNPPVSAEAGALLGAFAKTGYFFPMIKIIEILTGVMLVTNTLAPLAAVLISPVLVGITTIHLFLNPAGLPMMLALHALHGVIVYGYWDYFKPMFAVKAKVSSGASEAEGGTHKATQLAGSAQ